MEFVVEPWHWFVLGILLILSELILPAFAALWFGIAAVMVCILLWLFPMMGFTTQVITWGTIRTPLKMVIAIKAKSAKTTIVPTDIGNPLLCL